MIVSAIILSLLSHLPGSFNEPGIDYSPRLLHREVNAIFNGNEYRMTEITPGGTSETGSHTNGKFFSINSVADGENITAYIGRVNSCRAGGCSDQSITSMDKQSEYFDYFILFDADKKVKLVRVFNYAATHGQEVAVRRWLDQFVGYYGARPLRVGKEIDAISGATISVYAIVADVKDKSLLLKEHIN